MITPFHPNEILHQVELLSCLVAPPEPPDGVRLTGVRLTLCSLADCVTARGDQPGCPSQGKCLMFSTGCQSCQVAAMVAPV